MNSTLNTGGEEVSDDDFFLIENLSGASSPG